MPTRKLWDYAIDMKEGFMPRKGKMYPLSRKEKEEMSGSQEVDLVSFHLFSLFIFLSYLLSYSPFILFLACRTRVRGGMSQVTGGRF